MPNGHNEATVRRYLEEVWEQGQLGLIDQLIAEDYVRHHGGRIRRGRAALRQLVERNRNTYRDLDVTIDELAEANGIVAARLTVTGTDQGGVMGLDPTNRRVSVTCMGFFRLAGDQIAESWHCLDEFHVLQQLGGRITLAASEPGGQAGPPAQARRRRGRS